MPAPSESVSGLSLAPACSPVVLLLDVFLHIRPNSVLNSCRHTVVARARPFWQNYMEVSDIYWYLKYHIPAKEVARSNVVISRVARNNTNDISIEECYVKNVFLFPLNRSVKDGSRCSKL